MLVCRQCAIFSEDKERKDKDNYSDFIIAKAYRHYMLYIVTSFIEGLSMVQSSRDSLKIAFDKLKYN